MAKYLIGYPDKSYPRLTHFGYSDEPSFFDSGTHWHIGYEFVYFAHGQSKVKVRENAPPLTMMENDILIMAPDSVHTFATPPDPIHYFWLGFQTGHLVAQANEYLMFPAGTPARNLDGMNIHYRKDIDPQIDKLSGSLKIDDITIIRRMPEAELPFRTIREEILRPKAFSKQIIHLKLLELLTLILRRLHSRSLDQCQEIIRYTADYLQAHYQKSISLSELGRVSGFHPSYLCRKFKEQIGIPPMQYLLEFRLLKAKEMLLRGVSVTETARRCGFSDVHHFSALFKEKEGIPPSRYG